MGFIAGRAFDFRAGFGQCLPPAPTVARLHVCEAAWVRDALRSTGLATGA